MKKPRFDFQPREPQPVETPKLPDAAAHAMPVAQESKPFLEDLARILVEDYLKRQGAKRGGR